MSTQTNWPKIGRRIRSQKLQYIQFDFSLCSMDLEEDNTSVNLAREQIEKGEVALEKEIMDILK